ncbi:MAG TPA: ABC transporter ATP-binding protein [Planctomycetota bacterium]|nr:ABC transporter ATP-binding protein [Planctomycetota bacterium]
MTPAGTLAVNNLVKEYPAPGARLTVLAGVSLTASPGDTVAIIGPSGSGKSTLLNIIGTLDKPTTGTVTLCGEDVTRLTGRALSEFRARRVGFVFQDHHLLPQLTALENVLLPTIAAGGGGDTAGKAHGLLERLGVAGRADAFPAQMSGGERQRVAVARALINGARLLLCDEPTGNLDRDTGAEIGSLFLELAAQEAVTVIMVTHNLELALRFARCYELRGGRLNKT